MVELIAERPRDQPCRFRISLRQRSASSTVTTLRSRQTGQCTIVSPSMLMPGERPSQHGHSSNPSTTFSGPSSLNVSTTLCSLMVILLCPLPLLRQGVCFGCALIAHHFSGATPSLRTEGLRRDLDASARNLQA